MIANPSTLTSVLPAGYTSRPATLDDAEAVAAAGNAHSLETVGQADHLAEGWREDWQLLGFDRERDTRLVHGPDGALAAFAAVWDFAPHVKPELYVLVHPAHRRRGLGGWLLDWSLARAGQAVPQAPAQARVAVTAWVNQLSTAALAVLGQRGFRLARLNMRMLLDLDGPPAAPVCPPGVTLRGMVRGQDERAAHHAKREAFRDHWGFVDRPFEESLARWVAELETRPNFDPGLYLLAVAGGQVIGTTFGSRAMPGRDERAWISAVGVIRPWRRRGVAEALVRQCLVELYQRGERRIALGVDTDSLTGAPRLYEKIGFTQDPRHTYGTWEIELRPGAELTTTRPVPEA
jgi:mycothiol synthase